MQDKIYANPKPIKDFVFDETVAEVFSDMVNRSVPGYATIVSMTGVLAERYATPGSICYDLGCSLGASTLSMRHHLNQVDCQIVGIDNAQAMTERCLENINKDTANTPVSIRCEDLTESDIQNASVVVMNFTLQFIAPEKRQALIQKIYDGLNPGGILILSEKITFPDSDLNELFIDLHHRFKACNGYSEMEISQKRAAIEHVMNPESLNAHRERLTTVGFNKIDVWFQCFNFASMVAIK